MTDVGLAPDDPDFDISGGEDVKALLQAEERHFWHRARNRFIVNRLRAIGVCPGKRVLELGCGAGCVAAALARAGYDVTGVEGHVPLLEVARQRTGSASFVCHDLRSGPPPLANAAPFDAVALFDVIEHVDDPAHLLLMAAELAGTHGMVVGTVPALMSLWSGIDVHAGHKTRYSEAGLKALFAELPGIRTVEIVPFFRVLVPMLWLQRRVVGRHGDTPSAARNLAVPWSPINTALGVMCTMEERLAPVWTRIGVPGASLWFCLARSGQTRRG